MQQGSRSPPSTILVHPRRRRGAPPTATILPPIRLRREQVEDLQKRYRQSDAANYLGISLTAMKNACKKLRLGPWPCSRTGDGEEEETTAGRDEERDESEGTSTEVIEEILFEEELEEGSSDKKEDMEGESGARQENLDLSQSIGGRDVRWKSELLDEALEHVMS
uniref:RWP-RK domain-containing protein n=1 Tax=Guillardia theta TaxID=55529 RepID=A0A7S4PAU8_GUITH|mmetsp:Transcript_47080/g.147377  ORF Transcript_47080/g.147377 Transcript_47080/m.147377 type:complete len:165 (+) Transcript_47080:47-541(+)